MLLPGIGEAGQRLLQKRAALVVGCGALGCAVAEWLARAGVGRIVLVDRDVVEVTNLQRQVLFDERDARAGTPKAAAAAERLKCVNSAVRVDAHVSDVRPLSIERFMRLAHDSGSPAELAPGERASARLVEVVIDCTDNFQTRYLINDACVKHHVPLVYAGVVATTCTLLTVRPGDGPCLRCVFPDAPAPGAVATCDTAGVLGPLVGIASGVQATEALKILLGREDLCSRSLVAMDVWSNRSHSLDISGARRATEDDPCPCCVAHRFDHLDAPAEELTALCGSDAIQVTPPGCTRLVLDLAALAARLAPHGQFQCSPHLVRGTLSGERDRESGRPLRLTVFPDARAIVSGTTDGALARSIVARYVGV